MKISLKPLSRFRGPLLCAKVDHWQNSSQRHRWLATALLDIEPRLRKVMGYRHLPRLRDALKRELKIDTTTSTKKVA